jgi:hypothetical protein
MACFSRKIGKESVIAIEVQPSTYQVVPGKLEFFPRGQSISNYKCEIQISDNEAIHVDPKPIEPSSDRIFLKLESWTSTGYALPTVFDLHFVSF